MTPTERGRRSDALYYDTHNVARRMLCNMVAEREGEIEELKELVRGMRHCIETQECDGKCPLFMETCRMDRECRRLGVFR